MSRRRLLVCVLLALWGVVLGTGRASAHDVLIGSGPADGSSVADLPTVVSFTFDQPVTNFDPIISITGPDGNPYQNGAVTVAGNVITTVTHAGPAGPYTAAYRIVSADGHPVTGQVRFTVTTGTGPAGPAPQITPAGAAGPGSGSPGWIWLAVAVAAILVLVAVGLLMRRPGGAVTEPPDAERPAPAP